MVMPDITASILPALSAGSSSEKGISTRVSFTPMVLASAFARSTSKPISSPLFDFIENGGWLPVVPTRISDFFRIEESTFWLVAGKAKARRKLSIKNREKRLIKDFRFGDIPGRGQ